MLAVACGHHQYYVLIHVLTNHGFHCLFCHGFEEAGGSSAGVIASGLITDPRMAMHMAAMAAPLAEDLVIYADGDLSVAKQMTAASDGKRVMVEPRKIAAIERKHPDHTKVVVHFEDGSTKEETFMVRTHTG
jgi:hypothetical protein